MRNQKAASTFLGQVVGKLFKARVTRDLNNGQKLAHAHRLGLLKSKHRNPVGHAADGATLVLTLTLTLTLTPTPTLTLTLTRSPSRARTCRPSPPSTRTPTWPSG